jgi:hypothetical protein
MAERDRPDLERVRDAMREHDDRPGDDAAEEPPREEEDDERGEDDEEG